MTDDKAPSAEVMAIRDLMASRWVGYALNAAATLNVADALAGGPRPAASVAETVGADPVTLARLLRALVTIGLLRQREDGAYELTPVGALLRTDAPDRFRDQILLNGSERALKSWIHFVDCVRTGATAAKIVEGVDDPFAWFAERPEEQARFDAAMAEGTRGMAEAIGRAYDFTGIASIVDVGGGYGTLLPPILHAYPAMTGTVFDRPHCADGAAANAEKEGLADRYGFVSGDFFTDALPAGADAYLLKSVIHDWDDERSVAVLRRCREAMREDSRLLMVEVVLPDRLADEPAHRRMVWADLNMLVATGGRERTESEYNTLFDAAGLRVSRILPTRTTANMSVVEVLSHFR
jgi:orsellinic acid C2-O-methyltransferase